MKNGGGQKPWMWRRKGRWLPVSKGHLISCFVFLFPPVFCSLRYREQLVIGTERPSKPVLRKMKASVEPEAGEIFSGDCKVHKSVMYPV